MMKAIDMYESIADHRVDGTELRGDDGVIKSSNGGRRYKAVSYTHLTLPTTPYV